MPVPIALVLAAFFQTQPAPAPPTHDRDPWVFRCVLDDNPRMLIISLGDHWWMAFDTVHCSIYKVWKGEIELTGAVYDTKHGPQPHAKGRFVLDGKSSIVFEAGSKDSYASWRGYELNGDHVILKWNRGDVAFELSPTLYGDSLRLVVAHSAGAKASVRVPNAVAYSTDQTSDVDGSNVNADIQLPATGPLTITLPLAEKNTDNQEPKK